MGNLNSESNFLIADITFSHGLHLLLSVGRPTEPHSNTYNSIPRGKNQVFFYNQAKSCAKVITSGIVTAAATVLKETISTESGVSAPYFEENIVVIAATGALTEIITETSRVPLTPKRYKAPSTARG